MSQFTTPTLEKLQQAVTAHRQGNFDVAGALYREILAANPEHFDAMHLLGLVELHHGRTDEAIALITKAVSINNRNAPAYSNLASALRSAGRLDDALAAAGRAVNLQSDNAETQYNRALILLDLKRYEEALSGFRKSVALNPGFADAHMNLGITLQALERLDEALESLKKANALRPHHANTLHNLGHLYQRLKRIPDATQAFRDAITVDPQHAEAHVALSECLLEAGDYAQGWREYEWRWATPILSPHKRAFLQPAWTGAEDVSNKTLLIHAEQGLGDTLMFARYLKHVGARAGRVIFDVQPALKSLFTAQDGLEVYAHGEQLPHFDMHCALLSLPHVLAIGADFSPAPYIRAPQAQVDTWRARLGPRKGLRCGVVWTSGTATRGSGLYRSMPATFLKSLTSTGVELIGLQPDVHDGDRAALAALPNFVNVGPEFQNFADTAGAMSNMDIVVTVDTAAAHLAGAMGKTVLILLAYHHDWRWNAGPERDTSVWYPSARLIRQPKLHDWDSVMAEVAAELSKRS